ncbi:hypothetical protein CALCODRAFT_493040 [Calocera cornea HHB12733]|uniref:Uncharacterized protein n=1 Tax=Calocera cornea HHB12733 TaxID=1353952 RepID=A0A165I297_9BASI|nr:hypothetical protein CALCODRAFT_493040 [Calocera cornea HHB12733]
MDTEGFFGARVGGPITRIVNGREYELAGDELKTDDDPKGELKINARGQLQGGREFKAHTFTSPYRSDVERLYMLSIDAARTSGFRDSLYFFRRNPLLVKLTLSQGEKDALIADGKLSTNLKSRSVTMVTARSAYKCQGAKLIKDGKWVTDDYYEDKAREDCLAQGINPGDPVGELPDPMAAVDPAQALRKTTTAYDRASKPTNDMTTRYGGIGLSPFVGEMGQAKRQMLLREGVDERTWMWRTAMDVWESNDEIRRLREERLQGFSQPWDLGAWSKAGRTEVVMPPEGAGLSNVAPAAPPPVTYARSPAPGTQTGTKLPGTPQPENLFVQALGQKRGSSEMLEEPAEAVPAAKRRRTDLAMGLYDGYTDLPMFRNDTQPTSARWEKAPDSRMLLAGTNKVGSQAWGLAYVEVVMDLTQGAGKEEEGRKEPLLQEMVLDPALM